MTRSFLFRGIGPPMINQIVMNSVMFTVFHNMKSMTMAMAMPTTATDANDDNTTTTTNNQANTLFNPTASAFLAGLVSGFATACLSTPTDWLKIQAQLSSSSAPSSYSARSLLGNLWRESSSRGTTTTTTTTIGGTIAARWTTGKTLQRFLSTLYRGHRANLLREGVFTMVYLGMYDRMLAYYVTTMNLPTNTKNHDAKNQDTHDTKNHADCDVAIEDYHYHHCQQPQPQPPMGMVILISSFTGACAWVCNYPFDTIKSVIQAGNKAPPAAPTAIGNGNGSGGNNKYKNHTTTTTTTTTVSSLRATIRSIYRLGGWKGFYRGVGTSTLRAMLVTSSRMFAYEKTLQLIGPPIM